MKPLLFYTLLIIAGIFAFILISAIFAGFIAALKTFLIKGTFAKNFKEIFLEIFLRFLNPLEWFCR